MLSLLLLSFRKYFPDEEKKADVVPISSTVKNYSERAEELKKKSKEKSTPEESVLLKDLSQLSQTIMAHLV